MLHTYNPSQYPYAPRTYSEIHQESNSQLKKYISPEKLDEIIQETPQAEELRSKYQPLGNFYHQYLTLLEQRLCPIVDAAFEGKAEASVSCDTPYNIYGGYNIPGAMQITPEELLEIDAEITKKVLQVLNIHAQPVNSDSEMNKDIIPAHQMPYGSYSAVKAPQLQCSWKVNNPFVYPEIARKQHSTPNPKDVKSNELRKTMGDFILKLPNEEEFRADRVTLAASSEYFKTLFEEKFKDSKENTALIDFGIDIDADTLNAYLDFLYLGTIDLSKEESIDRITSLGLLADATEVPQLKEICSEELRLRLEEETFWPIAFYAHKVKDEALRERCILFAQQNKKWIENTADFSDKEIDDLLKILNVGQYFGSEEIEERAYQEIIKKADSKAFINICEEANKNGRLKQLCIEHVRNTPEFAKEASKEALAAYVKLLTNGSLDILDRLKEV